MSNEINLNTIKYLKQPKIFIAVTEEVEEWCVLHVTSNSSCNSLSVLIGTI